MPCSRTSIAAWRSSSRPWHRRLPSQDLFARLEAEEFFLRIDPGIAPTMFRGALISEAELGLLRRIEDVVRFGHVRRIERDEIVLDEGCVPTSETTLHVHCAASRAGATTAAPDLRARTGDGPAALLGIRLLPVRHAGRGRGHRGQRRGEEPPVSAHRYWDADTDYLSAFLASLANAAARAAHPALASWGRPHGSIRSAGSRCTAMTPASSTLVNASSASGRRRPAIW